MRRKKPMTEFLEEPFAASPAEPAPARATEFEKRRGISGVEAREGFAQVHVSRLTGNLVHERIRVLGAVGEANVSLDFLKLTPSGLSFMIPESLGEATEKALSSLAVQFSVKKDRSIVLVHAVNVRDEEGLTATIVQHAIASGALVEHVTDMHDRMLMVVATADAEHLVGYLTARLGGQA